VTRLSTNGVATKPPRARRPGVIRADEVVTSRELKDRMAWGCHAFNQARKTGLPCRRHGNTRIITGSDFIKWVESLPYETT
jgi:hypothetical protein